MRTPIDTDESDPGEDPDTIDDSFTGESLVTSYLNSLCSQIREEARIVKSRGHVESNSLVKQISLGHCWVSPRDPCVALYESVVCRGEDVSPKYFYYPRMFVFAPDLTLPYARIRCSCGGDTATKGWSDKLRRVVDNHDCYYIFGRRYSCKCCQKHFVCYSDEVLQTLPLEVQLAFPAVLSHRSGLSRDLMHNIISFVDMSIGPTAAAKHIAENHTRRHAEFQLRYYSTLRSILSLQQPTLHFSAQRLKTAPGSMFEKIPLFSKFKDQSGYCGFLPSGMMPIRSTI